MQLVFETLTGVSFEPLLESYKPGSFCLLVRDHRMPGTFEAKEKTRSSVQGSILSSFERVKGCSINRGNGNFPAKPLE